LAGLGCDKRNTGKREGFVLYNAEYDKSKHPVPENQSHVGPEHEMAAIAECGFEAIKVLGSAMAEGIPRKHFS
jgi:hypothetical protein